MTDMKSDDGEEKEVLSRTQASELAKNYKSDGQPDPFPSIRPSLLSADHIEKYVMETGAIAPFFMGGGRHSRLKKASYEGRIGKSAYRYNKYGMLESILLEEELTIDANSIVFVECDLDFRLPDFIALRFNLQIRHVHRGLLLGTGPLVDPGYWGKLCIPLHNLTDEKYSIPLDYGLIWVEFTKTTVNGGATGSLGRTPLEKEYWEVRDFIEKAARPIRGTGASVPIRSSISKVRERAENAEETAKKAEGRVSGIAMGAAILGLVAFFGLAVGFATLMQDAYNSLSPRVDGLEEHFFNIEKVIANTDSENLPATITDLMREHEELREKVEDIERMVADQETYAP